ncbi:MAG: TVP38/TMEM64 family protein [Clostridium sp.]
MELIYFIICIIQPIILPTPEAVTVMTASFFLGGFKAFVIGFIGTIIGVSIMYFLAKKYGSKIIDKFNAKNQLDKYMKYIENNQLLVTGILFIIPILPDEIVCIGAGVTGVSFKTLISIAILCKGITVFMYAYSVEIAQAFNIGTLEIIIIQLMLLLLICMVSKKVKLRYE